MAVTTISTAGIANDAVTTAKTSYSTSPFRNLIINGDMSIAQRGTSTSGVTTTDGYYTCDRWRSQTDTGTWTISQSTDVPTGQGFANSFKMDCTSAGTSNADEVGIRQYIEGQFLQQLAYGTSSAKSITISFWIKSNKTGDYTFSIKNVNSSQERLLGFNYTIDSANTWEKKTFTFSGDTSTSIENTNSAEFELYWWFSTASAFRTGTVSNTWQNYSVGDFAISTLAGLGGSTDDEVYLTGVQLEVGTSASDFEFLPFDVNFQRCQRYFQVLGDGTPYSSTSVGGNRIAIGQRDGSGSTAGYPIIFTQCQMRATPSIAHNNVNVRQDGTNYTLSSIDTIKNFGMTIGFNIIVSSALGTGESFQLRTTGSNGYIRFDAEL
jgi:hypothetical protein